MVSTLGGEVTRVALAAEIRSHAAVGTDETRERVLELLDCHRRPNPPKRLRLRGVGNGNLVRFQGDRQGDGVDIRDVVIDQVEVVGADVVCVFRVKPIR